MQMQWDVMNWHVNYMENRKIRPVSFNLLDPYEVELNEFVKNKGKFSKNVKRLIQKDKEGTFIMVQSEEKPKKKGVASSFI